MTIAEYAAELDRKLQELKALGEQAKNVAKVKEAYGALLDEVHGQIDFIEHGIA